jgi:hypothetical protein
MHYRMTSKVKPYGDETSSPMSERPLRLDCLTYTNVNQRLR